MLSRVAVAAFLLFASLSPAAAEPGPKTTTNPDPYGPDRAKVAFDEDRARRFVNDFARCAADFQPRKAAAALAMRYNSKEQANAFNAIGSAEESCWGAFTGTVSIRWSSASMAGGMAEYFILHPAKIADLRKRDPQSFVYVEPDGAEVFGDCVVGGNAAGVEALIKSDIGSKAESAADEALGTAFGSCVTAGQTISVDAGALRDLLAVALYKHIAMPPPAEPAAAPVQH